MLAPVHTCSGSARHTWLLQAHLIEYNLDAVDGAINAVRVAAHSWNSMPGCCRHS